MVRVLVLLCLLLTAQSAPLFAQQHQHSAGMQHPRPSVGLVKKIDLTKQQVMLQHGPLENLGMPGMTMGFGVAQTSWLKTLKVGDKIRFNAELGADGNPLIKQYELVPN